MQGTATLTYIFCCVKILTTARYKYKFGERSRFEIMIIHGYFIGLTCNLGGRPVAQT